nr:histidine phosphatase family protein [Sulfitobacter algicola]
MRHGQTEWNAADRMQGRLNSPLTAVGKAQAIAQGMILQRQDLNGFNAIASPQVRALHTAALALEALFQTIETDARLCEIDVGNFNGELRDKIKISHPDLFDDTRPFDWYDKAPGGEGFAGLEARCRSFLDALETPAVLVTHGITSRFLRCIAMGRDVQDMADLPGGQGIVYHVQNGHHDILD